MSDEKEPADGGSTGDDEKSHDSAPERVTFWASVLIVVALFGFLTYRAFTATKPDSPDAKPSASVSIDGAKTRKMDDAHWTIPVTVYNSGNLPLEEVSVRVTTLGDDGKEKEVDLAFAYLAEGAREEAFIVTTTAPEKAKPEAEVTAFKTQRKPRGY